MSKYSDDMMSSDLLVHPSRQQCILQILQYTVPVSGVFHPCCMLIILRRVFIDFVDCRQSLLIVVRVNDVNILVLF